eukprot:CAMPEP_0167741436 /NCGR_PEP_ID=MMETSP0110_2-20121227/857_1 /TAXON_ID=629695 /ORGANISM="Gymnochlora sp., Strain CCMP2014" /LENGTH=215 /DNA_ID=CAMNT_0007625491 /DNA_START=33 /DNA_END=680 /DNA_ORIENTATION=-
MTIRKQRHLRPSFLKNILQWSSKSVESLTPKTQRPPLNVVITGSTRGLGFALAEAHLRKGDNVFINGRSKSSVEKAVSILSKKYRKQVVWGLPGDVSDPDFVRMLGLSAKQWLGHVDIWINNAAISYPVKRKFTETQPSELSRVVNTNVLGVLYGTQTASLLMRHQDKGGSIFNVEGMGSNGVSKLRGLWSLEGVGGPDVKEFKGRISRYKCSGS